jgi:eukaryotic-like serine/threonine-protein kinase
VDPPKSADPTELGGIALHGRLGQGAMGVVYYGIAPDGEQYRQAHAALSDRLAAATTLQEPSQRRAGDQ